MPHLPVEIDKIIFVELGRMHKQQDITCQFFEIERGGQKAELLPQFRSLSAASVT